MTRVIDLEAIRADDERDRREFLCTHKLVTRRIRRDDVDVPFGLEVRVDPDGVITQGEYPGIQIQDHEVEWRPNQKEKDDVL